MEESAEKIDGQKMLAMFQEWIDSRKLCKLVIPNTEHGWITLLLGIHPEGYPPSLTIDKVKGIEKIISRYEKKGLDLEFLEKDGVLCWFQSRLIEFQPQALRIAMPQYIVRMQRRRYVRITARSGTEVFFQRDNGRAISAKVKDYGLGGISFFTPPFFNLNLDEYVSEMELRIPDEKGWNRFHIPRSKVKRLEKTAGGGLCVVEFIEIPEIEKEHLWHYIFKEQRFLLRKTGKI